MLSSWAILANSILSFIYSFAFSPHSHYSKCLLSLIFQHSIYSSTSYLIQLSYYQLSYYHSSSTAAGSSLAASSIASFIFCSLSLHHILDCVLNNFLYPRSRLLKSP